MLIRSYLLPLLAVPLLLTACAEPVTKRPGLSRDAVVNERDIQKTRLAKTSARRNAKTVISDKAFGDVVVRVQQAGSQFCGKYHPPTTQNCIYATEYITKGKDSEMVNAFADGEKMYFTKAIVNLSPDINHLATVVAHEYAHNLMGHVDQSKQDMTMGGLLGAALDAVAASQGISTGGQFSQLGAGVARAKYSKARESEADYVGLYIMHLAGYDISKSPELWRIMAQNTPEMIDFGSSHPTSPERYVLLNETIKEIKHKQKHKLPLRPELAPVEE